ncbi:hypothetical protein LC087_19280 (plasmid) [Bacillus carboniphilus]|uniref:Uncharacterized protein n=1 Tax=Bacillus carboniphilus TaxID=86663 RepID=A0ABY9JYP2_9BACI|nr:hypothetical protein [Bacillus carboniphilus]WLR44511.1 hypothetical protein LC087_19280 [Bacillus carboniphilus]
MDFHSAVDMIASILADSSNTVQEALDILEEVKADLFRTPLD